MKSKAFVCCLITLAILSLSCKKESSRGIVGEWESVLVYTMQNNGGYGWTSTENHPQFYSFFAEGRFSSSTDVPGGSGKYSYDSELQNLILNYEVDCYGNLPGSQTCKVELLTNNKLILSYSSPGNNFVYQTEYSRVN